MDVGPRIDRSYIVMVRGDNEDARRTCRIVSRELMEIQESEIYFYSVTLVLLNSNLIIRTAGTTDRTRIPPGIASQVGYVLYNLVAVIMAVLNNIVYS